MSVEKILVVDDERLVRWSFRQKCEEWGYQVLEAAGGGAQSDLARLVRNPVADLSAIHPQPAVVVENPPNRSATCSSRDWVFKICVLLST